jgi:hypothetical protein
MQFSLSTRRDAGLKLRQQRHVAFDAASVSVNAERSLVRRVVFFECIISDLAMRMDGGVLGTLLFSGYFSSEPFSSRSGASPTSSLLGT